MKIHDILYEIDYAAALGDLALTDRELIAASTKDGSIGSRHVFKFEHGVERIYFFKNGDKIDALIYLADGNELMGIKNFTANRGLVYNLFQYLINMKRMSIRISPYNKLTQQGIDWICDQNDRDSPFTIRDLNGDKLNSQKLRDEWEIARQTRHHGPTGLIISESHIGESLRLNENRLIPMDIYGATLTNLRVSISEDLDDMVILNTLRTGIKLP